MAESLPLPDARWQYRIFPFLASQTLSLFGSSLVQYAIVWHITLSFASGTMLMLATLCAFLPQVVVSLFAGAWVDRFSRKRIILISDGSIALTTLLLALFWHFSSQSWMLFVALAIRSVGTGIQSPAVLAVIPQLTPPEKLARINGLNGTLNALTQFLSPAISALLLAFLPLEGMFMIDVLTAMVGMGILSRIAIPSLKRETTSALHDLCEGFVALKESPMLRRLLGFQAAILILISPAAFLTPLLVSRLFGPELWRLSASEMVYSAGAVAGGALITAWGGWKNRLHTVYAAGGLYGAGMICMGFAPLFPVYLVSNAIMGIATSCYSASLTTHIQEKTPAERHGRIFAFMQVASGCALPLGMTVFGPLGDIFPLVWILVCCGVVVMLLSLSMHFSRMLPDAL